MMLQLKGTFESRKQRGKGGRKREERGEGNPGRGMKIQEHSSQKRQLTLFRGPPPKRQKSNSEAGPLKEVKYGNTMTVLRADSDRPQHHHLVKKISLYSSGHAGTSLGESKE